LAQIYQSHLDVAEKLAAEGATLAVTYQGETLEGRVRKLAETLRAPVVAPCNVTSDEEIGRMFEFVGTELGGLDILVHAIAYADKEALAGMYCAVTRQAFLQALEIGAYSFTALARGAAPLMEDGGGSMVTLTYFGAEKVVPHYNIMGVTKAALEASVRYLAADLGPQGIRVNAISAGPVKTLSAKGVRDFSAMLTHASEKAPLKRNITGQDVGSAGLFLLSELSAGITGEVMHVDAGYNVIGM
ncbi:MAG: enoyl-ACP reductase, partial [Candidatus Krumholzibacteriia bacterium]